MPDLEHLHPIFRVRVEATGVDVFSGARSTKRQGELYQQFLNGTGNPANPPGTSWHEYGEGMAGGTYALAVDFAEPYPHGAPGLCFPIRNEPWHAQPEEITEPHRVDGAESRLPDDTPPADNPPAPVETKTEDDFFILGENMQRFPARIRSNKINNHVIYDIDSVWEDGKTLNEVKYSSWLLIRPETDPGKEVTFSVWINGNRRDVQYKWSGNAWGIAVPEYGFVSVMCLEDVPLIVFWELAAGKA